MYDAFDVPRDALHATSKHDDLPHDTPRPKTPLPDSSRTLRRTISYASIDTIRPSSHKGVRRCINEIADNLKIKSERKKKKHGSAHDVPKSLASDSRAPPASKATKHRRKATAPLRDTSHSSEEESVLAIADSLHSGVPSERDLLFTPVGCESDPLVDKPLIKDAQLWEDCGFLTGSLNLGLGVAFQSPLTPKASVKDVQLDIRPSESDVTIWDGLQASVFSFFSYYYQAGGLTKGVMPFHHSAYHLFRCRLYLRCTTHPYDGVSLPDTPRIEMDCKTNPVRSRYARPPVLQTAYTGASPGWVTSSSGLPNVNLAAGIHIDRFWRTILDADGTWGWYRDTFVPLSPRLFDKMDCREFELVSRVWVGESCLEAELRFGISMLLRGVDME